MDKRYHGRFCIQFNLANSRHIQAITLLESQGRRKAQFIADAILHYAKCSETPEIKEQQDPAMFRNIVESYVRDCLKKGSPLPAAGSAPDNPVLLTETQNTESLPSADGLPLDGDLLACIRASMETLCKDA